MDLLRLDQGTQGRPLEVVEKVPLKLKEEITHSSVAPKGKIYLWRDQQRGMERNPPLMINDHHTLLLL